MRVMKTGTAVRLKQPVVEGLIVGGKLAESGDEIEYQVAFLQPSGEYHVRHFNSDSLNPVVDEDKARLELQHTKFLASLVEGAQKDRENAEKHRLEAGSPEGEGK